MFESLLGKNIEIHIDDTVVKSKMVSEHLGDLRVIFEILRSYKLRLNASKRSESTRLNSSHENTSRMPSSA